MHDYRNDPPEEDSSPCCENCKYKPDFVENMANILIGRCKWADGNRPFWIVKSEWADEIEYRRGTVIGRDCKAWRRI